MPVNKRNWRKQEEHIQVMNTMKALKKQLGEIVNEGRPKGSGTAQVRFMSGGSSTRKAVRPTATEKLALIRKLSANGGIVHRQRCALKMGI